MPRSRKRTASNVWTANWSSLGAAGFVTFGGTTELEIILAEAGIGAGTTTEYGAQTVGYAKAVRGQVFLQNNDASQTNFFVAARIFKRQVSPSEQYSPDLSSAADAVDQWLWNKVWYFKGASLSRNMSLETEGGLSHPWWMDVSWKGVRRINEDEELVLKFAAPAAVDDTVIYKGWLRALVSVPT